MMLENPEAFLEGRKMLILDRVCDSARVTFSTVISQLQLDEMTFMYQLPRGIAAT